MAEEPTRKLAVLLHADVVGSTALVRLNETVAHQRIQDTFRRFSETITNCGGTVHEVRGDALVAEFPMGSDAVAAAVDFQAANIVHNERLPDEIRPVIRVGIAMGEVVFADDTVTGEGVVLAQRLEQSAEAGGVCIQGAVFETIPKRLPYDYENLGELVLKGFVEPLRVYSVKGKSDVSTNVDVRSEDGPVESSNKPSIAVLPFTNMSGDPEQDYFSDGVAEDIITGLSHFRELLVIARNSSFAYKGQPVDVAEISKQLGVRYVVEGSVRKSGNRVRVTAQLVEAEGRQHVWAQRYDRDLSDVFEVQDEITRLIVGAVAGRVDAAEAQRARMKPPQDMSSYDYFLRGLHEFNPSGTASGDPSVRSREFFRKAIDIDARFARAYAYLAFSLYCDVWYLSLGRSHLDEALEMVQKALALDPDDSFAKAVHGLILITMGRAEGVPMVELALQRNPNDAEILHYFGFALSMLGRTDEGTAFIREAIRLNPFNHLWDHSLAMSLGVGGNHEGAAEILQRYADMDWRWTIAFLAAAYAQLDRMDDARRLALRSATLVAETLNDMGEPVPEDPLDVVVEGLSRVVGFEGVPGYIDYVVDGFRRMRPA